MKAVDQLADRFYVLTDERELPEEQQTRFNIRGLPYDLYQTIQAKAAPRLRAPAKAFGGKKTEGMEDTEVEWDSGRRLGLEFEILSFGLLDVENLIGPDGQAIPYPGQTAKEAIKKEWLARWLTPAVRLELANEISEGSSLREDEEGN